MASKLPGSLECVLLRWFKEAPVEIIDAFKRVLDDFDKQAQALLPSLRSLAVRDVSAREEMKKLCPDYKDYGWHSLSHLDICFQPRCDCGMWDPLLCSDIDWRYLVGDPNPGTYGSPPDPGIDSDDED